MIDNQTVFTPRGFKEKRVDMRLLLVDDEEETRLGIMESMQWSALGITEIRQCEDGAQALDIIEQFRPDILLADVRMPHLIGTELASKVHEILPNCQIIFMSGYCDKEYLLSAIKVSAIDYVEKPLELPRLHDAIKRATQSVLKISQSQELVNIKDRVARRELVEAVARGETVHEELLPKWEKNDRFCSLILHVPQSSPDTEDILERYCCTWCKWALAALHAKNEYMLHITIDSNAGLEALVTGIADCVRNDQEAHVFVGKLVDRFDQLPVSWQTANAARNLSFFHPDQNIFYFSQMRGAIDNPTQLSEQLIGKIIESPGLAYDDLCAFVELLRKHDGTSPDLLRTLFYLILKNTYMALPDQRQAVSTPDNARKDIWNVLQSADSLDSLVRILRVCLTQRIEDARSGRDIAHSIAAITHYIAEHFADPEISIDILAQYIHISPAYLCVIYKNETGKTIKQVISSYRMQKAKELLNATDMLVNDIAKHAGFHNGNYFAKFFHRETGLSPQEYRKRNQKV